MFWACNAYSIWDQEDGMEWGPKICGGKGLHKKPWEDPPRNMGSWGPEKIVEGGG